MERKLVKNFSRVYLTDTVLVAQVVFNEITVYPLCIYLLTSDAIHILTNVLPFNLNTEFLNTLPRREISLYVVYCLGSFVLFFKKALKIRGHRFLL